MRVPIHLLGGVVCFGRVGASPALLGLCAQRGVAVSFLSRNGRFLARVQGPVSGNVLLRRAQYRRSDEPAFVAGVARSIVAAKILNARTVLLRARRDGAAQGDALHHAARRLRHGLRDLDQAENVDAVRGFEGDAARTYFGVFDHLIVQQRETFRFERRSRRPPLDPVNALLSFLYTLLVHDVVAALESVGLDPAVGFLHRDRPGRPSLALDLMEELRPVLADRVVLGLINRRRVKASDFRTQEAGAVRMSDDARKTVIEAYQSRKREELRHPFLDERVTVGHLSHLQALLFARFLREDLDAYPPFLWR